MFLRYAVAFPSASHQPDSLDFIQVINPIQSSTAVVEEITAKLVVTESGVVAESFAWPMRRVPVPSQEKQQIQVPASPRRIV